MSALRPPATALLLSLSLFACSVSESTPGAVMDPDPQVDEDITDLDGPMAGGETGSMGPRECFNTNECTTAAQAQIDALTEPLVLDRALIGSECVATGDGDSNHCCYHAPAACLCYYGWNGGTTRDYGNAQVLGNREDCDVYGRALDCLSTADDFEGCDPEVADSCEAACQALDERLVADQARSIDAELRGSTCTETGTCQTVLRIEDRCYAGYGPAREVYDCALSDEEILELAFPPSAPPQCDEDGCDAGSAEASAGESTPAQ